MTSAGTTPRAARPRWLDVGLAAALGLLGTAVGARYVAAVVGSGGRPFFYQAEFGAAVMFACGRGFRDPAPVVRLAPSSPGPGASLAAGGTGASAEALGAFLRVERDAVSCAELPPDLRLAPPTRFQRQFLYLFGMVGLAWRCSTVSWSGLYPLFGSLFGATAAIAYVLFRLVTGRAAAVLLAALLILSPTHLTNLPNLRDYIKAPFFLALVACAGVLAMKPLAGRSLVLLAAAFGSILGLGFGCRPDVLAAAVPFAVSFVIDAVRRGKGRLREPLAAAAVAVGVFLAVAWPVMRGYDAGNKMHHVILLGLGSPFDSELGVSGSLYDLSYRYDDSVVGAAIVHYHHRAGGDPHARVLGRAAYERAAAAYFWELAQVFPADMVTRTYAAVLQVLELPLRAGFPGIAVRPLLARLYSARALVLSCLGGLGVACAFLAILVVAATSTGRATLLLLLLLYFCALPALQFHERHYFHLEFMGWLAIGFLGRRAHGGLRSMVSAGRGHGLDLRPARRAVVFGVTVLALFALPLVLLRPYQDRQVGALIRSYGQAEKEPVPFTAEVPRDGSVRLRIPGQPDDRTTVTGEFLAVELTPQACGALVADVGFRYDSRPPFSDGSQDVQFETGSDPGSWWVFFPVYWSRELGLSFEGLELRQELLPCLAGVYRFRETPRLALPVTVPPSWPALRRHQVMRWEDTGSAVPSRAVGTAPPWLSVTRRMLAGGTPLPPQDVVFRAEGVKFEEGRWAFEGKAASPFSYLLATRPRPLAAETVVMLEGRVRGGISLGLVGPRGWEAVVNVDGDKAFVAAVMAPRTDLYSLVVAHDLPKTPSRSGPSLRNHVVISEGGIP